MTPERWNQVKEIFQAALECETGQRAALLDEVCAGDEGLRREVESMLIADAGITNPLDGPISQMAATLLLPDQSSIMLDRRIGVYRVTGLIGQGGMGAVYRAVRDDQQYDKEVAIKLVKGGLGPDFALQRFRRERQILARLEHTNIARLLDGGTTEDGWPYLVMEYIEGQPLSDYCKANSLTIAQRLELFRSVCSAVQYAHQNLIIHRDIKPSNILVTAATKKEGGKEGGVPKLLDFGIAKLLDPEQSLNTAGTDPGKTATAMRVMTPAYASPEQARGEAVTTATDTYSLGVVLYELLTGQLPYHIKGNSLAEIERAICDIEPEKPSVMARQSTISSTKLGRQLAGDLDNIILMAMRKEPERRYHSVEQFSEDIRRHLDGLPVLARQDTITYRTSKFVRRHRWGLAAAAIIVALLIGGILVSLSQARRADRQAHQAQQRFQQVRKLANTFLFDFHDKIQNLQGATEAREMLVKTALEYLDNLAREAKDDPNLQWELATAYDKVGDVQGNPRVSNLGQMDAALESYNRGLAMARELTARAPDDMKYLRLLANAHFKIGDIEVNQGHTAASISACRQGIEVAEKLAALPNKEVGDLVLLMRGHANLCDAEIETNNNAVGVQHCQQALQVAERRAHEFPGDKAQQDVATRYTHLGYALIQNGDPATAVDRLRNALAIIEPLVEKHPTEWPYKRVVFLTYQIMGQAQGHPDWINLGDPNGALDSFRKMLAITEQHIAADSKDLQGRYDLAIGHIIIGQTQVEVAPIIGAESLQTALADLHALLKAEPDDFRYQMLELETTTSLARSSQAHGDIQSALRQFQQAQTMRQKLEVQHPKESTLNKRGYFIFRGLGDTFLELKDFPAALENYRQMMAIAETELAAAPSDLYMIWFLAESHSRLGLYYEKLAGQHQTSPEQRLENLQQARNWYQKSLAIWDRWTEKGINGVNGVFNSTRRESTAQALARCESQMSR